MKDSLDKRYVHDDSDIPVEYFEEIEISIKEQEKIMELDWYIQWMKEYHK
ncbi:hypothetical protein RWZ02_15760 [Clostridium butyricum]|nr:hypothetical protein [Clostridium butyricum]MDU0324130.1 hypothetical protein [Clostridium butyricum]